MIINSDSPFNNIEISSEILNRSIAEMLDEQSNSQNCPESVTGYDTQFEVIKSEFANNPSKKLGKMDIAKRLSLLDLFYTTNFNRFVEFGLEDLTDTIWNLCADVDGQHSDSILVKKIETFVNKCITDPIQARNNVIFSDLFASSVKFGITKVTNVSNGNAAQSIISKYFFFLLENHHSVGNTLGFPIYDSIAKELQNPLLNKLGKKIRSRNDIVGYINKMSLILECLKAGSGNTIWHMPSTVCNTQFGLLDYFLWRIGKSGKFSFSLLWSRNEKRKHYLTIHNLKESTDTNLINEFATLPNRFKDWHLLYNSIINRD